MSDTKSGGTPSAFEVIGTVDAQGKAQAVSAALPLPVNLATGDIEIGAVEIKNGSSDQRATVSAGGALLVDASATTQPVSGPLTNAQLVAATVLVESTTTKTVKFAKIDTATSGAGNTIVAAVTSKKITVLAYSFVVSGAVTAQWFTGTSASLSGAMSFAANGGISKVAPNIEVPLLQTVSGEALKMTLGGAIQVSGELTYYEA